MKERTDTERLDWYHENYYVIGRSNRGDGWRWYNPAKYVRMKPVPWQHFAHLRQAIDAAMDAEE